MSPPAGEREIENGPGKDHRVGGRTHGHQPGGEGGEGVEVKVGSLRIGPSAILLLLKRAFA